MSYDTSRPSRIHRIAELMIRYRAEEVGGKWRIRDIESGGLLPGEYADEGMAKSGARMAAACDAHALFDDIIDRREVK